MPPQSRGEADIGPPGAGTLFVYGREKIQGSGRSNSRPGSRSKERQSKEWPRLWGDIPVGSDLDPGSTGSADPLLERGIAEYSYMPESSGGVLGRGKFSTVYKVVGTDGRFYALKHTPLHPHHPLIAARLLREPTLLAQLKPHPCLIGVEGWVRTEGHFYLIEEYATSHVPLPSHPLPLSPSRAAYILDQLVSVIRDCLHTGRVCHRDLKGENVLVNVDTGDLLIIDLGLATQFSSSEAKLTTCCGSPAFHSPEIVNALNHPPGVITYYGPELDIWCIALTLLSMLTQTRFPLGPSHSSRYIMAERVLDRLQELDKLYPPETPYLATRQRCTSEQRGHETSEWQRVRKAMKDFLEIDGIKRMEHFRKYSIGEQMISRLSSIGIPGDEKKEEARETFKQITFVPGEVKYTLPLYLLPTDPAGPIGVILSNPHQEAEKRVVSYLKYLLRTAGILYHVIPPSNDPDKKYPTFQLVLPIPPDSGDSANSKVNPSIGIAEESNWITSIFRRNPRSASVPPQERNRPGGNPTKVKAEEVKPRYIRCWAMIEFTYPPRVPGGGSIRSRTSSGRHGRTRSTSTATTTTAVSRVRSQSTHHHHRRDPSASAPTSPILGGDHDYDSQRQYHHRPPFHSNKTSPEMPTSATLSAAAAALLMPHHQRPGSNRTSSTSRLPRVREGHQIFSPLSRQVSLEDDSHVADADDEGTGKPSVPPRSPTSTKNSTRSNPSSRGNSRQGSRANSRAPSRTNSQSAQSTTSQTSGNSSPRGSIPGGGSATGSGVGTGSGSERSGVHHRRIGSGTTPELGFTSTHTSPMSPLEPISASPTSNTEDRPPLARTASRRSTKKSISSEIQNTGNKPASLYHQSPTTSKSTPSITTSPISLTHNSSLHHSDSRRKRAESRNALSRPPGGTRGARVIIHLSDVRAIPVVRKAVDVEHSPETEVLPYNTPRLGRAPSLTSSSSSSDVEQDNHQNRLSNELGGTAGLAVPPRNIDRNGTGLQLSSGDDEGERGRPRSKGESRLDHFGSTTSLTATSNGGNGNNGGEYTTSTNRRDRDDTPKASDSSKRINQPLSPSPKRIREPSRGRRLLEGIFGVNPPAVVVSDRDREHHRDRDRSPTAPLPPVGAYVPRGEARSMSVPPFAWSSPSLNPSMNPFI